MRLFLVRVKYGLYTLGFAFLVIIQGVLVGLPKASATAPYLASDVLGQGDFDSGDDNYGSDNSESISWLVDNRDVEIDTVHHRLFVADRNRVLIYNLNSSNLLEDKEADYVLGQSNFDESDWDTTASGFSSPYSLAYDSENDRLFVADSDNDRVLIFDVASVSNDEPAVNVLGQANFTTGTSDINAKGFNTPHGLSYDSVNHRLYVADSTNHRVLVFDTTSISDNMDASYVLGQADLTSNVQNYDNGGGTLPADCSEVGTNTFYGCYYDNTDFTSLKELTNEQSIYHLWNSSAPFPSMGDETFSVRWKGNFTFLAGDYDFTAYVDDGVRLYVDGVLEIDSWVDQSPTVHSATVNMTAGTHEIVVEYYENTGGATFTFNWCQTGNFCGTSARASGFSYPRTVEIDSTNNRLYVSDSNNHRVLVFDTTSISNGESAVNVLGQPDFINSLSDNNAKGFESPWGISADITHDRLYVSDLGNNRVLVFDTTSISNNEDAIYVLGQADFTGEDYDLNAKGFQYPHGLVIDSVTDRLYATDPWNNRVLVFDTTSISNNEDAIYGLGSRSFNSTSLENIPSAEGFSSDGLTPLLDTTHHRLFVSDSENCRILIFNLDSDNNLLDKVADYVLGQDSFDGNECDYAADRFYNQGGLAYDSENNLLFVADTYDNCRIMIFDVNVIENGEDATNILGGDDLNDTGGCDVTAQDIYYSPYYGSLVYDSVKKWLYVDDRYNGYRIMVFDLSNGITDYMPASYVLGAADLSSYGDGDVSATGIYSSYGGGIVLDEQRQLLFVTNYDQNRVMVFDVDEITAGEPAIHVLGQPDFETDDENTSITSLDGPLGAGYDPEQQLLFVAEYGNGRIMVFDVSEITDGEPAVAVLGAPDFDTQGDGYNDVVSQETVYPYDHADIAFDTTNRRLYVGSDGQARVLIFDLVKLPSSLSSPTAGTPYASTVAVSNAQGAVTYSLASGALPAGLSLNTSTGAITGTPTTVGSYSFTIKAIDDNGAIGSFWDTQSYVLGVAAVTNSSNESNTVTTTSANTVSSSGDEEVVAVSDSPNLISTPIKTPVSAPKTQEVPSSSRFSVVWWGAGGFSLLFLLLALGIWINKKTSY